MGGKKGPSQKRPKYTVKSAPVRSAQNTQSKAPPESPLPSQLKAIWAIIFQISLHSQGDFNALKFRCFDQVVYKMHLKFGCNSKLQVLQAILPRFQCK